MNCWLELKNVKEIYKIIWMSATNLVELDVACSPVQKKKTKVGITERAALYMVIFLNLKKPMVIFFTLKKPMTTRQWCRRDGIWFQ